MNLSNDKYINSVLKSLYKFYGNGIELYESSRKDKKFMIQDPNGKWVHFGQKGYEDWHSHKDPVRLERFRKRNKKWADAEKWTPAHLSWFVLWS
jgi:hypothetical protein